MTDEERIQITREMVRDEFESWRKQRREGIESQNRNENSMFLNAWAMIAYRAEAERDAKNHEINKLQQRIHRQRVANRKANERIRELEAALEDTLRGVLDMRGSLEAGGHHKESREANALYLGLLRHRKDQGARIVPKEIQE